jgi:hypothetical protein
MHIKSRDRLNFDKNPLLNPFFLGFFPADTSAFWVGAEPILVERAVSVPTHSYQFPDTAHTFKAEFPD